MQLEPLDNAAVQAIGVKQRLGGRQILHGIDLEAGVGIYGLLGPNGAGKTTLLRILSTVRSPSAGEVRVAGLSARDSAERVEARRLLGYLPQHFAFYGRFTALETVEYIAWLRQVPPNEVRGRALEALAAVDLSSSSGSPMRRLSGGMIRRVGIAQAIVGNPSVLILDEPTTGLDPAQRIEFRQLIRSLGKHMAVLLSTHLIDDIGATCDRVAVIDGGELRFDGTVGDFGACANDDLAGDSVFERAYGAILRGAP